MQKKLFSNLYFVIFFICLLGILNNLTFADATQEKTTERETLFPVSQTPTQITLTLTESPTDSISIQWSTSTDIKEGMVEYKKKTTDPNEPTFKSSAQSLSIIDPPLKNNPEITRWYTTVKSLEPDTNYEYRVGSPEREIWSNWYTFKTAPPQTKNFSFMYLGDAQVGWEEWGKLLATAIEKNPECVFILMAGDLSNRGNERDDWDLFFHYAGEIFAKYPIVPTIGNHEYKSTPLMPKMYLDYFVLPQNGPENVPAEYCYSFKYSNAKFVILNGNHEPELQRPWLEQQLANSDSIWKFLMFHQPIYSSGLRRDNKHLRDAWLPVIDQYHVDIVFQGHDHSYWRTYPLKNNQKVSSPSEGTYYVISFSGTKSYEQKEPTEIIETAFTKIPTYQIITIETGNNNNNRLIYRSFDKDGNIRDEFTINKTGQNQQSLQFNIQWIVKPELLASAF